MNENPHIPEEDLSLIILHLSMIGGAVPPLNWQEGDVFAMDLEVVHIALTNIAKWIERTFEIDSAEAVRLRELAWEKVNAFQEKKEESAKGNGHPPMTLEV